MKTIILGLGNTLLSDDGIGIYLLRKLRGQSLGVQPIDTTDEFSHFSQFLANSHPNPIDFIESPVAGFRLLDLLEGYDKAIIIDAIKTEHPGTDHVFCLPGSAGGQGDLSPNHSRTLPAIGTLHKFTLADFKGTIHMTSVHDINLATALELAKKMDIKMPKEITIYAIEVKETLTFSEKLTPELEKHLPKLTATLHTQIVGDSP